MRSIHRGILVASAVLAVASPARAHFVLQSPASWMSQDAFGSPQKGPPCGDEGGGTATNMVTAYRTGDTVSITIDEKVFHPGHYRVALATTDRSQLPAEPAVTAGAQACGTAAVQDPPVFPVLADNLLVHTTAFSGPQTVTVKLPAGVTCTKCTLQVIEFMSDHALNVPGGCFYHHCADISISDQVVTPSDAGVPGGDMSGAPSASSGCSFATRSVTTSGLALALLCLVVLARRRRAAS